MQTELQFHSTATILQYLKASQDYLSKQKPRRLAFDFPDIHAQCPVCQQAQCSRWKGYYTRKVVCYDLNFFGKVVIHCGQCRRKRIDFSYFPSFLIPYFHLSKASLRELAALYQDASSVEEANAQLCEGFEHEQPLSSAYFRLYHLFVVLSLNAERLSLHGSQQHSVERLRQINTKTKLGDLIEKCERWHHEPKSARAPPRA